MTSPLNRGIQSGAQSLLRTAIRPTTTVHQYSTKFDHSHHQSAKQSTRFDNVKTVAGLVGVLYAGAIFLAIPAGLVIGAVSGLLEEEDLFDKPIAMISTGAAGALVAPVLVATSPILLAHWAFKKISGKD